MKRLTMMIAVLLSCAPPAFAAGDHTGGHGHHDMMAIGKSALAKDATRTIDIIMRETADGQMLFEPASLDVREGETVRLKFHNAGETDHEFVMDTTDAVIEHKARMEASPGMQHDDPNAIRLAPGATGEIVWTFANAGEFIFACLIPGHYESGMHGLLRVAR
jgi:uncharacterized cupredoxin-like copper-binding protein